MTNLQKLQAEIISDPDNRGYAAMTDGEVLARVKSRRFADVHIIWATEVLPVPYNHLPDDVRTIVNRVMDNGGRVPNERKAIRRRLKEVFGDDDGIEENRFVVLVRQYTSIVEELGIGYDVTLADIQTVRAL